MEHTHIEHLSKQQIVLLTLFVAFVASIATGITVVALLDQAPQSVSQGINQVVEHTIEKIVPVQTTTPGQSQIVTVQVPQDDLAVTAVGKGIKSVARIYDVITGTKKFVGMGVVVDASGTIATDKALLASDQSYVAVVDGSADISIASSPLPIGDAHGVGFFAPINGTAGVALTPATMGTTTPQLGQTIVSLGGQDKDSVQQGIVSSLESASDGSTDGIQTTLDKSTLIDGSPIVTLDGSIAGITVMSSGFDSNVFIPSTLITAVYAGASQK